MRPSRVSNHTNSSMQLTRAADYAVRVMVHLAQAQKDTRTMLPELARAAGAPDSFLSKVLQSLVRARLVSSRRGKDGGFAILPQGLEATMCDVIETVDGPICLNVCLETGRGCDRKAWCPAHPVWSEAQQAMLRVLRGARIADLAQQAPAWSAPNARSGNQEPSGLMRILPV